jgi:cell division protein FtsQ
MPISDDFSAHVVTVNGFINETDLTKNVNTVINNDSLKTIEILDDLYAISNYVCSNKFFTSQITHIFVNNLKEFELSPRVGNQRIMFGKAENIAGKFKKLDVFYKEGISNAGWEKYDTINLMYKNQVVCSKR